MSEDSTNQTSGSDQAAEIDPIQLDFAIERIRSEQNLVAGILVGSAAAALGAAAWAAVTVMTGYQIGWMAVGIGFGVGYAIRVVGKGIDRVYGIVGGALALIGCAAGNLFAVCGLVADQEGLGIMDVVSRLDPTLVQELMIATFSPMDLLFYGIAVYEGYRLSFREVTDADLGEPGPFGQPAPPTGGLSSARDKR